MTENRPGPTRPGPTRPTAPAANPVGQPGYAAAGALTSDQAVNGNAADYAWLDDKIVEVVGYVQQSLVAANRADDIDKARRDADLRARMSQDIDRIALQYLLQQRAVTGEQRAVLIASVVNEILGLGPLEPLWADSSITEVIANGPDDVYVEYAGVLRKATGVRFRSQEHLLEVCQRILAPLNRKVDVRDPLADGRLPDGSRVNVVHTALAPRGPLLTIRRFPERTRSMVDLVDIGSMDQGMATLLATLVQARASMLVVGGTGSGKALDVDTPIPTPDGFIRMGDLQVGDVVFDEKGQPTTVIGAYTPECDRPCFEVEFSDGSVIVADEEHLWQTETRSARRARSRQRRRTVPAARQPILTPDESQILVSTLARIPSDASVTASELSGLLGWHDAGRRWRWYPVVEECTVTAKTPKNGERMFLAHELIPKALERWGTPWHDQRHLSEKPRVRTTGEIRDTLRAGQHSNHSIPVISSPAAYPVRDLPLHPRLLGLWLGDGASANARFSTADEELLEEFKRANYSVRHISRYDYSIPGGLQTVLRELGVFKNKHIPDVYLYSSEQQRRDLLSGLLDTDGSVSMSGGVEFYSSNERLARQVLTLAASLGYRPTIREKNATLNGQDYGPTWTVAFLGHGHEFGLERKIEAQSQRRKVSQGDRDRHRYIVDVRPVESRPVRCIRVANESHLFLAGETYIPTHNTTLLNALSVAIPRSERLVTIEDSLELRLHSGAHVAAMEARPPDSSGKNGVTIRQLVKNALRMRPDRIIVGEIRDAAALDMLQACNTGHEGSMSTVHANGPNEAISRLTVMVAQGGEIPAEKVDWLVGSALDVVVMARRYEDGSRRVSGIYEVPDMATLKPGEALLTVPLWEWEQTGVGEDGRLVGHYVQRGEASEGLRKAKGLDDDGHLITWDQLRHMCGAPGADTFPVTDPTQEATP